MYDDQIKVGIHNHNHVVPHGGRSAPGQLDMPPHDSHSEPTASHHEVIPI